MAHRIIVIGAGIEGLATALAPGAAEYGLSAVGLAVAGDEVRIQLADGIARVADAVIGADGIRSVVTRHLNGPLPDRYVGYTAWRGVATYDMDPQLAGETLGPGVETGHVPRGAGRLYWFAGERAPEGQLSPAGELPYLQARFADWPEPIPRMLATTAPGDVLRNDLYDRSRARTWAHGPIVVSAICPPPSPASRCFAGAALRA